MFVALYKNQ